MSKSLVKPKLLNSPFLKARGIALVLEHLPCCGLAFLAGFAGVSFISHDPLLELAFAIGGALLGEKIVHKFFLTDEKCDCSDSHSSKKYKLRGYLLAIGIGIFSWAVHRLIFHHDH